MARWRVINQRIVAAKGEELQNLRSPQMILIQVVSEDASQAYCWWKVYLETTPGELPQSRVSAAAMARSWRNRPHSFRFVQVGGILHCQRKCHNESKWLTVALCRLSGTPVDYQYLIWRIVTQVCACWSFVRQMSCISMLSKCDNIQEVCHQLWYKALKCK